MLFSSINYVIQLISFFFSIIFNFLLIYLILMKSPKKMGTYKYLLVYFCSFSLLYSVLNLIVEPYIHSHGSALFVMMHLKFLKSTPNIAFLFISLLVGCYAISITTISIQFVFRYFAMERKGRISYFRGKYLVIWFLIPLITGSLWIAFSWIYFYPTAKLSHYISETVYLHYAINISDITYTGVLLYPPDENGIPHIDYEILWSFLMLCFSMCITFGTVVIFGLKSFKLVRELPKQGESAYTYKLQSQLFKAVVAQAFIPITFLFFPVGLLFIAPLLHFDIEPASFLVTIFYSMYPAVDPLPVLLIVEDYRNGLSELISNHSRNRLARIGLSSSGTNDTAAN